MKYLKEFIIGSSFPTFFILFVFTHDIIQKKKQTNPEHLEYLKKKESPFFLPFWNKISKYSYYTYYSYTLTLPIYFGILNIISLIIADHFKLSKRMRFVIIAIISSIIIMITTTIDNIYNWTTKREQIQYYINLFIGYMFLWNIIVYNIDKYME
tara:strand:+ start:43 stop:504 length:462 start_codon:yes stop_codon:yes gene_type:complete